jgi:Holliday junction DNA helicase RuvB
VRVGMLARTRQGRIATPAAWAHLGLKMGGPAGSPADDTLFDG